MLFMHYNRHLITFNWFTYLSPNCTWLVTSLSTRHDIWTCRAHAFWLCGACLTARLYTLETTSSTVWTRQTYRVVSRRDMTSQVEFGLYLLTYFYILIHYLLKNIVIVKYFPKYFMTFFILGQKFQKIMKFYNTGNNS